MGNPQRGAVPDIVANRDLSGILEKLQDFTGSVHFKKKKQHRGISRANHPFEGNKTQSYYAEKDTSGDRAPPSL